MAETAETAGESDERRGFPVTAVLVLVVVVLAVVAGVRALSGGEEEGPAPAGAARSIEVPAAPEGTPGTGTYVESEVAADGTVSVQQWIRSDTPIARVELRTADPDALPGTVEATGVLLSAPDGSRLAFRASVGTQTQRVRLREPASEVYVRYTIQGETLGQETATVAGRLLARVTGMDLVFAGESGPTVRVLRGPGTVLNAACLPTDAGFDAVPVPCGAAGSDGSWRIELLDERRHDRVIAQVGA